MTPGPLPTPAISSLSAVLHRSGAMRNRIERSPRTFVRGLAAEATRVDPAPSIRRDVIGEAQWCQSAVRSQTRFAAAGRVGSIE